MNRRCDTGQNVSNTVQGDYNNNNNNNNNNNYKTSIAPISSK